MASTSETCFTDEDSDDEKLSVIKRKCADSSPQNYNKKSRISDSDGDVIIPQVLVKVEIEEIDEKEALELNTDKANVTKNKKNNEEPTKPKRKRPAKPAAPKKNKVFPCMECDAVFEKAQQLRMHSVEHQEQTRHKCEYCGRCFKKAFCLRLHVRSHTDRNHKCPLCDVTYTMQVHLDRHLKTHEKTVECKQCSEKFHTPEQLEQHVATHNSSPVDEQIPQTPKPQKPDAASCGTAPLHETEETPTIKLEVETESDSEIIYDANFKYDNSDGDIKRETLSHPTQCAIVNKLHKGRSIADICTLYNLTPEVVSSIWEDRDKYSLPKRAGKRTMKYMNGIVDKKIVDWFNAQRANDVQVSGKMLQDAAESIAKECGFVAFNGTKKWLDRFKQRYNILLRGTPSTRDYHNLSADSKWKKMFFKEQWCDVRFGVSDDDIYTADEVGLFYNVSKGRIKKFGGKKFIQGHVKDRLSIFMCMNSTGTDKRKLLVCGTEDPLLRSYRNPDTLPVTYIRHTQAHFTTQIFEQYVKYWNAELQLQRRKAILVIDRANIHTKLQLSNLKLVFVPWKASSGLMPIKNGIFTRFRQEFRKLFLEEKAMNAVRGVDRNLTCLEALNMLEKAWERLPPDVIFKGFETTGYDIKPINVPDNPKSNGDEEMFCDMLKNYDVDTYFTDLQNLDMYLTVEEEYLTGQGTNGSVFGGNHKTVKTVKEEKCEDILPLSTEKPENLENEALVRRSRALEDLEMVRKYLHSSETNFEMFCSFMEVEKVLMRNPNPSVES